jgi:hypothetical protein
MASPVIAGSGSNPKGCLEEGDLLQIEGRPLDCFAIIARAPNGAAPAARA